MIDRDRFFPLARTHPFGSSMNQGQVDGINAILDKWDASGETDVRRLAYMLATSFWETNHTMQPVREAYYLGEPEPAESYRKRLRYYPWYGRGLVQLTWEDNYRKMSPLVGVDLIAKPDMALDHKVAVDILFEGMLRMKSGVGDFTGACLEMYFSSSIYDPVNARRIINGMDHAQDIANVHYAFLKALH